MTRTDIIIALVLLAIAIAMPLIFPVRYVIVQLSVFLIYATVVVHWNLVLGVGGIFSLAQVAFFAFGAYTAAMLGILGFNYWFGVLAGGLVAVILAVVVGIACLRLRGPYVGLLTLAVAVGLGAMIRADTSCFIPQGTGCIPFAGGAGGMTRYGDFGFRDLLGRNFFIGNYYVSLALFIIAFAAAIVVMKGPYGLAFRALRDNKRYAIARGVDHFRYQVMLFATSAFFTGLAGAVYAAHFRAIGPELLNIGFLLLLLSMVVIGGMGTVWGPLLGVAVIMLFSEGLREIGEFREIGMGLLIAATIVLMPSGIAGTIRKLWQRRESS